jgi:Mrp family chromosome partitioning ATPase
VVTNTVIDRVRLVNGLGENDPDANPLDVLAMQRKVIQATRSSFDMILLDTAPLLTTNDASELLSETDQVLLVVRSGKTKVESARRVTEVLERFNAPVIGVVMNDSTEAQTAQYYYGIYTSRSGDKSGGAVQSASNGGVANGGEMTPAELS